MPPATPPKVNRTAPDAEVAPSRPSFSTPPLDAEFFRARVFDEPLIPSAGPRDLGEDYALANLIAKHASSGATEDVEGFAEFLRTHPGSRWGASILVGLGVVYRRTGYFSRALESWERAWALLKAESDPRLRALADRALGELAELSARLGRQDRLERLLAEIDSRDVRGPANEKVTGARDGLSVMQTEPERAFLCGPFGLDRVLASLREGYVRDPRIAAAKSTRNGTSMLQMLELAENVGLKMQIARRTPGAAPIVPALVHWKAGHFAALVKQEDGRLLIQDPTFGDDLWITRAALDEEASGVYLVAPGELPAGWQALPSEAGATVWGKGIVTSASPQFQGPEQPSANSCPTTPMAQYKVNLLLVNLHVWDGPVGYQPPRGPAVRLTVAYNQRETFQPQIPAYSNFGPMWTFDWFAFVEDNPANAAQDVNVYLRGGGQETYTGMGSGTSAIHYRSRATLVRTSATRYERKLADGGKEVFAQPDGATAFPRRLYLTEIVDPQGNALTLAYSYEPTTGGYRITGATDAIGQVTTFSYEASDPLKITKVTDPFSRFAVFEYNTSGRLKKITDPIGITSEFAYGANDFINSLTTPYGTTSFAIGQSGANRWLEATDPMGAKERIEFLTVSDQLPASEASVPAGIATFNNYLHARNTFHWDKRAMAAMSARRDHKKAHIYHWLHSAANQNVASGILESEKKPLEGRVWYNYPGQSLGAHFEGSAAKPSAIARVLDDGVTQVFRAEYNAAGKTTKENDPLGRETVYVNGTGSTPDADPANGTGIDVLQVKQKNGAGWDVLWNATYNSQRQPLTVTSVSGHTTTYTYNAQGQLLTAETPARAGITEDRTTTYTYEASSGRLLSITGPAAGLTRTFAYDGYGRVRTITDVPDNYAVTTDYDALDRTTKVTYPDGTYEEVIYNRLDPAKHRDRLGRWVHTFYDALRRPVTIRDALGRTTTQDWCTCGSLDRIVDPNGNATSWERDLQARATKEVRADGSFAQLLYENTTGRLKTSKDPKQQSIEYVYNRDNTLAALTFKNSLGQADPSTPGVSFTYDPSYQRIATRTDGLGTTTYAYAPITNPPTLGAGSLSGVDGPVTGTTDQVSYGYDELGRAISQSLGGVAITQTYDALGRIVSETNALGSFTYNYVGVTGRLTSIVYPNGQSTTYDHMDRLGDFRLKEIHNMTSGGVTISKFNYTTDVLDRVTVVTQQAGAGPATRYAFEYDLGNQLTAATLSTTDPTPTVLKRYRYGYDRGWNRNLEQVDNGLVGASFSNLNSILTQQPSGALRFAGTVSEPATVTVHTTSAQVGADQKFSGSASVASGTNTVSVAASDPSGNVRTNTYEVALSGAPKSFSHDAAGNLSSDGSRTLEWDALNRLIAVNSGTQRTEYTYDGAGHRARVVEKSNGTVVSDKRYIWVGSGSEERDATGATVLKRFFSQGDQEGASSLFYTRDHIGSVRELMSNAGTLQGRYDYDPYGRASRSAGSRDADFGFTGHFRPLGAGLLLTPRRAYDADLGRWLNPDPIGLVGGINLYGYVLNDPINLVDPSGQGPRGRAAGAAAGAYIGGYLGAQGGAAMGAALGGLGGAPTGPGAVATAGAAGLAGAAAGAVALGLAGMQAGAATGDFLEDILLPPPAPITPPRRPIPVPAPPATPPPQTAPPTPPPPSPMPPPVVPQQQPDPLQCEPKPDEKCPLEEARDFDCVYKCSGGFYTRRKATFEDGKCAPYWPWP